MGVGAPPSEILYHTLTVEGDHSVSPIISCLILLRFIASQRLAHAVRHIPKTTKANKSAGGGERYEKKSSLPTEQARARFRD